MERCPLEKQSLSSGTDSTSVQKAGPPQPERVDAFVQLLAQNHRRLYLYISALVPNRSDAEDILQEASMVLWRCFDEFELGTNFTAWACRVTFNQILAWRKRQQRDRLEFSEAFLSAVAEDLSKELEVLDERSAALGKCIDKLPHHQRELIRLRYSDGQSVETIAVRSNRTVEAVYRMLSRIRQTLFECVNRVMGERGRTR